MPSCASSMNFLLHVLVYKVHLKFIPVYPIFNQLQKINFLNSGDLLNRLDLAKSSSISILTECETYQRVRKAKMEMGVSTSTTTLGIYKVEKGFEFQPPIASSTKKMGKENTL